MIRRMAVIVSCVILIAVNTGCASLLEREIFTAEAYIDTGAEGEGPTGTEISNYLELKNAIKWMVENYQETGELTFSGYDGDVREDLYRACEEIKSKTALGAYSVEYMSHIPRPIVSYYKAELNITYRRSFEEVQEILTLTGWDDSVDKAVMEAMSKAEDRLVIRTVSSSINADIIREIVTETYYDNPLKVIALPDVTITSYPEGGIERIFEILFDYGRTHKEILDMKEALNYAARELTDMFENELPAKNALSALEILSDLCEYIQITNYEQDGGDVPASKKMTAYDALVLKRADHEGMAMAYKALCELRNVPCIVVLGRMNRGAHTWNIIKIDGEYYHVDVSMAKEKGIEAVFLKNDTDMTANYFWDFDKYPPCVGSYTYYEMEGQSEEEGDQE